MTSTEANEFFAQRTVEVVGQDIQEKPSRVAPPPPSKRGKIRMVVTYHYDIPLDELKELEKAHGRRYFDGMDYGRALYAWITAEGKEPDHEAMKRNAVKVSYEVAK